MSKKKAEEEVEVEETETIDVTRFSDIRRYLTTIADIAEAFPTVVNGLDMHIQQAAKKRSAAMVAEIRRAINSLGHLESSLTVDDAVSRLTAVKAYIDQLEESVNGKVIHPESG